MKPFKPPVPLVTNSLIGLCIAVQTATAMIGGRFGEALAFNYGLVPARIMAALHGTAEPLSAALTLVTSLILHGGWLHLFFNMIFFAWVGRSVEWAAGRWVLLTLFLTGGIAGGLMQVASNTASPDPVVGASGAIAAVFGAYAVLYARQTVGARRVLGVLIASETLTALWYAAAWIGLQLLTGLVIGDSGAMGLGRIAIWTHIGGFITGLVLVQPWTRRNGPR